MWRLRCSHPRRKVADFLRVLAPHSEWHRHSASPTSSNGLPTAGPLLTAPLGAKDWNGKNSFSFPEKSGEWLHTSVPAAGRPVAVLCSLQAAPMLATRAWSWFRWPSPQAACCLSPTVASSHPCAFGVHLHCRLPVWRVGCPGNEVGDFTSHSNPWRAHTSYAAHCSLTVSRGSK